MGLGWFVHEKGNVLDMMVLGGFQDIELVLHVGLIVADFVKTEHTALEGEYPSIEGV